MKRQRRAFRGSSFGCCLVAIIVLCSGGGVARGADRFSEALSSITRDDLQRHLGFLASDALEGREAGSRGGHAAAAYLAERLKALGCSPAGEDGSYIQEFGRGYRNVLGVLTGSDPQRASQFILIGGHLDHVGYGTSLNSNGPVGRIHNGADDNASGVAAMLEVAEALTRLPSPLPRSVVFAFWDGEEKGLLGSKHWVNHPTLDISRVRLAMNLDMVGRLSGQTVTVYGSRTARGLRQFLVAANEQAGLKLDFNPVQQEDSDHYSFYTKSIPYLMLYTGEHADYHRPSDDVERINFEGLEVLTRMHLRLLAAAAECDECAAFRSEVREEFRSGQIAFQSPPARLGVTWAVSRKLGEPFPVVAVDPESPAAVAGVRKGDRIIRVGEIAAAEIEDLRTYLVDCDGELALTCERDGSDGPLNMPVRLAGCACPPGVTLRMDPADAKVMYVSQVAAGSAAEKAGFRSGDRIVQSNASTEARPTEGQRIRSWTIESKGRMKTVTLP